MKRALLIVAFVAALAGILFGCAGRVDLPFFWGYIGVPVIAAIVMMRHVDRDLMKERLRPGAGGTGRYLRIVLIPFWLAHLVIAGLDVGRFHWSDHVPLALQTVGLTLFAASYAVPAWAISVNRFYSSVIRIQADRGHVLVTDGPYAYIRHPGYAGILIALPAGGLALGSWWSLAPLIPLWLLILRRTIVEDRFLRRHLEGYLEYAARVRYRLVPHVW
jgi:protein-S-isoprenylcysteine O-methyltransferase Ste14